MSRLESNPARLEEIEARLAALDKLKRKYGGTLEEILAFERQVREKIAAVENAGERMEALAKERQNVAREYESKAAKLSQMRRAAAARSFHTRDERIKSTRHGAHHFSDRGWQGEWSETGADAVRFLVSPNAGEEPRPMEKIASGGEISRMALALKTCLTSAPLADSGARTLVFDEVDTGIGGSAAEGVARRLKKLAGANQVSV